MIFVTTTIAYYAYIVDFSGEVAAWSFIGFLGALFCCVRLLLTTPDDWGGHLFWVYVLFCTYVWWDAMMLLYFLPKQSDRKRAERDSQEIWGITSNINWPTLVGLLLIWFAARNMTQRHADAILVSNYVDGVIAFHLVFASSVALIKMFGNSTWQQVPEVIGTTSRDPSLVRSNLTESTEAGQSEEVPLVAPGVQ